MAQPNKLKSCSIVIRTYNEARYIGELLETIKSQKTARKVEVILIDSESTDKTIDLAKSIGVDRILKIPKEQFSYGRALNRGIQVASGDVFVAISGHCIPADENWLENLVRPFDGEDLAYVYGRQTGIPEKRHGHPSTRYSERRIFEKLYPKNSVPKLPEPAMNNANSAVRRDWWERIGFCENLPAQEDLDFAWKVERLGGHGAYVSDAIVMHLHDETNYKVFKRFFREEVSAIKILGQKRKPRLQIFFDFIRDYASDLASVAAHGHSYSRFFITITGYRFAQQYAIYLAHYGAPSRYVLDRVHDRILRILTKGHSTLRMLRDSREFHTFWYDAARVAKD